MGTKHPDIVRMPPSPIAVHTIGQMKAAGWHLTATCTRCGSRLWVDLEAVIALLGPDAFFWGRTGRCRVWTWGDRERCPGRVTFSARSITGGSWRPLGPSGEAVDGWRRAQAIRDGRNPDDWQTLLSYDPFARPRDPDADPHG